MSTQHNTEIERLLDIMARLRDPDGGCPWDVEQSFATIAPYTVEEAYEVAEAVSRDDMELLREELGDLLLQVVFHAQMAAEAETFTFEDVARSICDKMVRRHPHVFGEDEIDSAEAQTMAWEAHKAAERNRRAEAEGQPSGVLDGIPLALPALMRAEKLQRRAARAGFDWPRAEHVLDKIDEEIAELRAAIAGPAAAERVGEELGDLLFACVNLARHLAVDAETALRSANAKFERRFHRIETLLAERGRTLEDAGLEEMDRLWNQAKAEENQ